MTGQIYLLRNTVTDLIYIGATLQGMIRRMYRHKDRSLNPDYMDRPLYRAISKDSIDAFEYKILEEVEVETQADLFKIESDYIKKLDSANPAIGYNYRERQKFLDLEFKLPRNNTGRSKPVICIELNQGFASAKEASLAMKLSHNSVSSAISRRVTSGGYHWKFTNS